MVKFLNLPNVRGYMEKNETVIYVRLESGPWLKHKAFNSDLKGLVGAMMLATDVLAGKFYPECIVGDLDLEELENKAKRSLKRLSDR
jgi:hypothetical protein